VKTPAPDIVVTVAPEPHFTQRLAAHWRLKLWAGTAFTAGFLTLYLLIQRCPLRPPLAIPFTALDRWVGFHPGLFWLYESLWLYLPPAPWLMVRRAEVVSYCRVLAGMSLFAFAVFLFWPTCVDRPAVPAGCLGYRLLTAIDRPVNACPSLHAAMVVFSGVCTHGVCRRLGVPWGFRLLNLVWGLAILYATLATRQHLFADVVAGAALGVAGCLCWHRLRCRSEAR